MESGTQKSVFCLLYFATHFLKTIENNNGCNDLAQWPACMKEKQNYNLQNILMVLHGLLSILVEKNLHT